MHITIMESKPHIHRLALNIHINQKDKINVFSIVQRRKKVTTHMNLTCEACK